MKDTEAKEVKTGSAIPKLFDQFESMDLAFALTLAPGESESSIDCYIIPP